MGGGGSECVDGERIKKRGRELKRVQVLGKGCEEGGGCVDRLEGLSEGEKLAGAKEKKVLWR